MDVHTNPLTYDLLATAAILCFESAIHVRRTIPRPMIPCNELHKRKTRFETAKEILKQGNTLVSELGLHTSDLEWALRQRRRVRNDTQWTKKFRAAKRQLKKHESAPPSKS